MNLMSYSGPSLCDPQITLVLYCHPLFALNLLCLEDGDPSLLCFLDSRLIPVLPGDDADIRPVLLVSVGLLQLLNAVEDVVVDTVQHHSLSIIGRDDNSLGFVGLPDLDVISF